MLILAILETLNFDFSKLGKFQIPNLPKIQSSESLKLPKMTFLDSLNPLTFDFTQNWSGGKIFKYQQSQSLTSHFESFWSIVRLVKKFDFLKKLTCKNLCETLAPG